MAVSEDVLTKREILEELKRGELIAAVERFELEVADRRVRELLIEALAPSRKATIAAILGELKRGSTEGAVPCFRPRRRRPKEGPRHRPADGHEAGEVVGPQLDRLGGLARDAEEQRVQPVVGTRRAAAHGAHERDAQLAGRRAEQRGQCVGIGGRGHDVVGRTATVLARLLGLGRRAHDVPAREARPEDVGTVLHEIGPQT